MKLVIAAMKAILHPNPKMSTLDKACSVCGTPENVDIETVTNVMPLPEEMFPVLLCPKHKKALQDKVLDIILDKSGKLCFIMKKSAN